MKKLIFKKLTKDLTSFFLLSAISISLIVWVIQAVNFLDFVSEDGHSFKVYFYYTLLSLPKIFSKVLPFVFFISLFYILIKYENNNELIIFWTIGIKKITFINTIIKFSIFFILIQLFLSVFLVPKTQDMARSYIRTSNIDLFPSLIKEKKFIDTVSNLTIFVEKINDNGEMTNIFLKDKFTSKESQIIYAKKGNLSDDQTGRFLILYDGKFINHDTKKTTMFSFDKTQFNLAKYSTKSITYPKIQELNTPLLLNCLYYLYYKKNERLDSSKLDCKQSFLKDVKQELFKRFYLPLYIMLIALISCFLILKSKDSYNYFKFKTSLFLLGVTTIIISEISIKYSGLNNLNSIIFLSCPIIIFILFYGYFYNKMKTLK